MPTRPSGAHRRRRLRPRRPGGYTTLHDVIKPFEKARMSMHFALGNHDHRDKFLAAFPKMKFERIDRREDTKQTRVALGDAAGELVPARFGGSPQDSDRRVRQDATDVARQSPRRPRPTNRR